MEEKNFVPIIMDEAQPLDASAEEDIVGAIQDQTEPLLGGNFFMDWVLRMIELVLIEYWSLFR